MSKRIEKVEVNIDYFFGAIVCEITYNENNEIKVVENNFCLIQQNEKYETIEEMIVEIIKEKLNEK